MAELIDDAPHLTGAPPERAEARPVSQFVAPPITVFDRPAGGVGRPARLWKPRRVFITRAAYAARHGRRIAERLDRLGVTYELLKGDRLPKLGVSGDVRQTYKLAKNTLAVVNAPAGQLRLTSIPPLGRLAVPPGEGLSGPLPVLLPGGQPAGGTHYAGLR